MWCCHCQQDVPAVAQTAHARPSCPRCGAYLDSGDDVAEVYAHPADTGVLLDSVPRRPDLTPPINPLEREQTHRHLRRIGRQLRTGYRHDSGFSLTSPERTWGPEALAKLQGEEQLRHIRNQAVRATEKNTSPTVTSHLIAFLLVAGTIGFVGGGGLLLWAAAFELPQPWQWGLSTTIAAEGALILGLTWMAGRLWRNSRQVNQQLAGVDRQLHDIEQLAGSLAGSHLSSSQHYYEHFSQGASSHMLLANLRGQVDQLASRMSSG